MTGPANDRQLDWRIQRLWELDGAGHQAILLTRLTESDVAGHPVHGVALLDRASHRVYIVNRQGALIDSVGRRGRGPGELSRPGAVAFDVEGNIAVVDRDKAAFVRWRGSDRALLEQAPAVGVFYGGGVQPLQGGFAYIDLATGGGGVRYRLMVNAGGEAREVLSGPLLASREAEFPSCGARLLGAPWFSPRLAWTTWRNRVAGAADYAYDISIFESGTPVLRVRRDIGPVRMTHALALRQLQGERIGTCVIPPQEAIRGFGFAPQLPVVEALAISPSGEIWVKRTRLRGETPLVDVFSAVGQYVGTLVGVPFPAAFIDAEHFVSVSVDSMDVPRLNAYRIARR